MQDTWYITGKTQPNVRKKENPQIHNTEKSQIPKPLTNKSPEIPHSRNHRRPAQRHPTRWSRPASHADGRSVPLFALRWDLSLLSLQPATAGPSRCPRRKKERDHRSTACSASISRLFRYFFFSLSLYLSDSLLKFENMFNSLSL